MVRHLGWHADAQIDIHTFRNIFRHTRGDLVFSFALVGHRFAHVSGLFFKATAHRGGARHLHDAVHKNAGRHDGLWV